MNRTYLIAVACAGVLFVGMGIAANQKYVASTQTQIAQVSGSGSGLIAHYTFDDTAVDAVSGETGTLTGGLGYASGKIGKALSFDGVDDVMSGVSLQGLNGASAASISFWMNRTGGAAAGLGGKWGTCRQFTLSFSDADTFRNIWRIGGSCGTGASFSHSGSGADFKQNTWQHVVLVYDNPTSKIYVNGALTSSLNGPGGLLNAGVTDAFKMGTISSNAYFQGLIDDLRIYNRALSANEIAELSGNQTSTEDPDPDPDEDQNEDPDPPTADIIPTEGDITYHVSVSGDNDNLGTAAQPFKTIQHCADVARAGNTCLVEAGTYNEHVSTQASGKAASVSACKPFSGSYPDFSVNSPCTAQRITFKAQGEVIMQGFDIGHEFVTIDGFTITGYTPSYQSHIKVLKSGGGRPGGNYCQIINNTIKDGANNVNGITFEKGAQYCLVKNNLLSSLNYTFLSVKGAYTLFEGNTLRRLNNRNYIYMFGHDNYFRRNVFIEGNRVAGFGGHPDMIQSFGSRTDTSYNQLLEENYMEGLDSQLGQVNSGGGEIGIIPEFHSWTFRRNVIANVSNNFNSAFPKLVFENNTFYKMAYGQQGIGYGGSLSRGDASYGVIRNNAFIEGGNTPTAAGSFTGFYGFDGSAVSAEVLRHHVVESNTTAGDTLARAISSDLVSRGYLLSTNGAISPLGKALSSATQLVLADTFAQYRTDIIAKIDPALARTESERKAVVDLFDNTVSAASYDSFKTKIYSVISRTKTLDERSKSTFIADYNFVTGAASAGYPAKRIRECAGNGTYVAFNFCEAHGINGGNPRLQQVSSILGPDNRIFTLDDGLKPLPGSPLCGKGDNGVDIGAYSCESDKVFSSGAGDLPDIPAFTDTDSDGDGVANATDLCPNTPDSIKAFVNVRGCAKPRIGNFDILPNLNTDLRSVSNLEIGITSLGKIRFNQNVSLTRDDSVIDVDGGLTIQNRKVIVDTNVVPELNKPATITLYNITQKNPKIMKDGQVCTQCQIVSFTNGTLIFTVPGF